MIRVTAFATAFGLITSMISASSESDWKPLFNGQNLDGWTQRGGKATYRVDGDEIVGTTAINTPNSFLCTGRDYSDFVLEFEVKIDPRLNSGVQFRSHSLPTYLNGRVHGYQAEIDPSARAWSGGIYEESKRGWLANLKNNDAGRQAFKNNQWNRYKVEAIGPELRTWVNDIPTAELHDALTSSGFIALQVHSTTSTEPMEVRWRNLRIKELPPATTTSLPSTPPPGAIVLFDGKNLDQWTNEKGEPSQWKLVDGAAEAVKGAGDLRGKRKFGDARFHVEFRTPHMPEKQGQARGNSGVYIQDRYEIQILDSFSTATDKDKGACGAIYQQTAPLINASRAPGEWQSYDIQFWAPRFDSDGNKTKNAEVMVHQNGVVVQARTEIKEPTGSAKKKGEKPGAKPLVLQEHGDPVQFRNVWAMETPE